MDTEIITFLIAAIASLGLAARALGKVSDSAGSMADTVKKLNDELQEVTCDRQRWNEERANLTVALAELRDQAVTNQQTIDALDRTVARTTGQLDEARREIETLKADREAQKQTIITLEAEIGRLQQRLAASQQEAAALRAELESLRESGKDGVIKKRRTI